MAIQKISGGSLEWNDAKFMSFISDEMMKAMEKATIYTQGVAKEMVGGAGTGREYKRGKKIHRASTPGSPPARDNGILANSISYTIKRTIFGVKGYVGSDIDKIRSEDSTSDVEYGYYLEKGTSRGIAARPWLLPSLIKAKPKITSIFKNAMKAIK